MATRLTDEFPSRTKAPTAAYPDGSYMNETAPGVNDGTPLDERIGDDYEGLKQGLLDKAGITPNGQPDSVTNPQQIQAIEKFIGDGDSQLAGGAIWPLSSQDSAQVGDDLTGYEFVRLVGGDFSNVNTFEILDFNGLGTIDGFTLVPPYTIAVDGNVYYLYIASYPSESSIDVRGTGAKKGQESTAAIQAALDTGRDVSVGDASNEFFISSRLETKNDTQSLIGRGKIKVSDSLSSPLDYMIYSIDNKIRIKDVTFDANTSGHGQTVNSCVRFESSGSSVVDGSIIEGVEFKGGATAAIRGLGVSNTKVSDCVIDDFTVGVLLSSDSGLDCSGNNVSNNKISNATTGIYILGEVNAGNPITGSITNNNEISDCLDHAIRHEWCDNVKANDNDIINITNGTDNSWSILFGIGCSNSQSNNNTIRSCRNGITWDTADSFNSVNYHHHQADGNKIRDIFRVAMRNNNASDLQWTNNRVREAQVGYFSASNAFGTFDPETGDYASGYYLQWSGNKADLCTIAGFQLAFSPSLITESIIEGNQATSCNTLKSSSGGGFVLDGVDDCTLIGNIGKNNFQSTIERGDFVINNSTGDIVSLKMQGNQGKIYFLDSSAASLTSDQFTIREHIWPTGFNWWVDGPLLTTLYQGAALVNAELKHLGMEQIILNPNSGDVTLNPSAAIELGYPGQTFVVNNRNPTNTVNIPNGAATANKSGGTVALGPNQSTSYIWTGFIWSEI